MRKKDFSPKELEKLTPEQRLALEAREIQRNSDTVFVVLCFIASFLIMMFISMGLGILALFASGYVWWQVSMQDLI